MKNERRGIPIFDAIAVHVKFVGIGKIRKPFDNDALGSVTFIEEGSDDGNARFARRRCHGFNRCCAENNRGLKSETRPGGAKSIAGK